MDVLKGQHKPHGILRKFNYSGQLDTLVADSHFELTTLLTSLHQYDTPLVTAAEMGMESVLPVRHHIMMTEQLAT